MNKIINSFIIVIIAVIIVMLINSFSYILGFITQIPMSFVYSVILLTLGTFLFGFFLIFKFKRRTFGLIAVLASLMNIGLWIYIYYFGILKYGI